MIAMAPIGHTSGFFPPFLFVEEAMSGVGVYDKHKYSSAKKCVSS